MTLFEFATDDLGSHDFVASQPIAPSEPLTVSAPHSVNQGVNAIPLTPVDWEGWEKDKRKYRSDPDTGIDISIRIADEYRNALNPVFDRIAAVAHGPKYGVGIVRIDIVVYRDDEFSDKSLQGDYSMQRPPDFRARRTAFELDENETAQIGKRLVQGNARHCALRGCKVTEIML